MDSSPVRRAATPFTTPWLREVEAATPEEQDSLSCARIPTWERAPASARPPPASRPARDWTASRRTNSSACNRLNAAYRDKFGFPFLYAVKGSTKHDILQALEQRLDNPPEQEYQEALRQVYRIAEFRLSDTVIRNMEQFASGWKRNYYGKGDVIVYRLNRDGKLPAGQSPVFGANIKMLVYGDAFWPTYTTGDNTGLIATDSMKNFIQRETLNFEGGDLEDCCQFLGAKFLATYPQVEGVQISAVEIPYAALPGSAVAFAPAGPERATARLELNRAGVVEIDFRHPRLQAAAPGRQRLPRLCARSIHHAARHSQSSAAHVARSGMALHGLSRWLQRRSYHR